MANPIGHLLDTMMLFDIVYENRPMHMAAVKFREGFRFGELGIDRVVGAQAENIIIESCMMVVPIIRNGINEVKEEWNTLQPKDREKVLDRIFAEIEAHEQLRVKKRKEFALETFKSIAAELLTSDLERVFDICNKLVDVNMARLRIRIDDIVKMFIVNDINFEANQAFSSKIYSLCNTTNSFRDTDSWDCDIFCNLLSIAAFGYNTTDQRLHGDFDTINFYTRDNRFKSNFDKFSARLKEEDKEYPLGKSLAKLTFKVNPY